MAEDARGFPIGVAPSQELAALLEITRVLTGTLDYQAIAEAVLQGAEALVGECAGFLWELDPDSEEFRVVAVRGFRPGGRALPRFRLGQGLTGLAAARREPAISVDIRDDPRVPYRDWLAAEGLVSALVLPLINGGTLLGTLNLFTRARHDFTPEEVRLLESFAAQAAAAIGKARLYAQSERRRRAAEAVAAVARLMAESLDPADVARRVADSVMMLLGVKATALYRVDPDSGDLVAVAMAGEHGPLLGKPLVVPRGTGISGIAVQQGRPVTSPDLLTDPRIPQAPGLRERIEKAPFRAALSVPLGAGDRVIGALAAADAAGRVFDEEDIRLVQTLADQATLALENARLFTEATRRRRQADELARIARTLTESLDVATVGARVVEAVQALFGVETSTVRLLESDGSLVSIGEVSPEPCFGVGHRQPPGAGVSGWAVVAGRPVRTRDLLSDPNVTLTDELRGQAMAQRYRAMVAVPLRAKGRIIGTLSIGTTADRDFAADELALLEACADQAALALENARLYEDAERGRREAEVLAELARAVSASLDLDTVLQRVTDGARELCGSDTAGIALADATGGVAIRYSSGIRSEGVRSLRIEAGKGVGGQVLVTGRPFRTADYAADPRISRDYVATVVIGEGIRCQLAVPVRIGERIEGLLYVSNRAPRPFTDRDESVLGRLAEEAAVAIQNARLFAGEQAARAEAEESGRRFRDLVQGLDAIVWECDAETWRYTFVSQRAETLLGYPIARWLGEADFRIRLVHPDDRDRMVALARAATAEGRDHEYEYRATAADGRVAWLRETVYVVPAREGRPRRLRGLTIDVTARRQAEAALRESEQRFRALSTSSPVGIFLTDVEGRCAYVNPRCRAICGFPFDGALEASWARFLHPEDRDRVLREWAAATRAGRGYSDEFRFVVHRVVRSVHVRSAPMSSDTGALLGHVGTVEDVGERKRAAETRRVLLGRVIAAQEDERARIARELHDETAQSLASLVIGLSALEQGRTPKAVRARLVELHALARAALGEVRRLAHGLRPSVLSLLGLGPAVERHAEEFGRLHQVAVSVRAAGLGRGRLPPAVETALYRIVQEALANVARHAGARAVTIVLGRDRPGVSLTVTDDGRGFDVQAAGAGPADVMHLGLENMRERAAALNGELTVESVPGRGTTVRATVPLPEEPDAQDQDPPRG